MVEKRAKTMQLHGNEYAQVAERIRMFREDCPNGKIITKRIPFDERDGNLENELTYRTYVWKDRKNYISGDMLSCDSSAEASLVIEMTVNGQPKEKKQKEKLETISVGRALAILGYLASGEVASAEEMEDFYKEKDEKLKREAVEHKEKVIDKLRTSSDLDELRNTYVNSGLTNDKDVIETKDEMKEKLLAKKSVVKQPSVKQGPKHGDAKQ